MSKKNSINTSKRAIAAMRPWIAQAARVRFPLRDGPSAGSGKAQRRVKLESGWYRECEAAEWDLRLQAAATR